MTFDRWNEPDRLDRAIRWAVEMHETQTDKLGKPYILHPLAVMLLVAQRGGNIVLMVAAVLHDVAEDCFDTPAEGLDAIELWFGPEVRRIVDAVTKRKGESYDDFITRVIAAGPEAAMLKLCDIDNNLDPRRLLKLDDATRERLLAKYLPARARLAEYLGPLLTAAAGG